jgi:uncharacterized protein YbbK (DUF523 family)
MQHILVSACLLGHPVRYDGKDAAADSEIFRRWQAEGRLVGVCPEMAGGLPTPRPPAEIRGGPGGAAVLAGRARVIDNTGSDASAAFIAGAQHALAIAVQRGIRLAVLKDDSPSCGSTHIYDGTFAGRKIQGFGVTAALLERHGIKVFSESHIREADAYVQQLEQTYHK